MHLQAKQSISSNNSPNVTQVLRAGKCVIMVKGHGKKAWRWRGLWGPCGAPQHRHPWGDGLEPVCGAGAWGCGWLPEVSATLTRAVQGKGPNPPGVVMLLGHAPCLELPQPPGYHINWEK